MPRANGPPGNSAPLVSVIVPVYNEIETISELLARVIAAPYLKQVIVVDDGSTDGTTDALRIWQDESQIEILQHEVNRGMGAAIRTALPHARGRFTIIQDADLEYDPQEYPRLVEPLLVGNARAVFGSRYMPETPPQPLWTGVVNGLLAMKFHVQNAAKSFVRRAMAFPARCATIVLNVLRRPRATDADVNPAQAAGSTLHPAQAASSLPGLPKRRLPRWGMRRLGATVFKLTSRMLYRAPLSDVTASLKAFSTDLLRKLDLQCERFEFGPEVTAKLCRAGEKIIEVPVRYERRVARRSKIFERFSRRPAEMDDRGSGRRRIAKKHRWNDGLHALDTLWMWRYWTMSVPDPERIPAAAPAVAVYTKKSTAGEIVSATVQTNLDHWAEEDAERSDFDEAAWNKLARPHPTDSSVDSLTEEVLVAPSEVQRGRALVAAAIAAAAASFEPRLMWEMFIRKPSPRVDDDSDEKDKGHDWEHWGLTDLLLLLAIVNIGLVLLVTMVTPFSSWSGLLLAVLASAVTFRTTRAGKFRLDKCNQAFAILTVLLVCSMFPDSWVWRGRTMLVLAALILLVGLLRLHSKGIRQPERNLLDLIGALALCFAGLQFASADRRAIELLVLLVSVTLFLGVNQRRKMRRSSDNLLFTGAVVCIFPVVVFSYLFPLDLWRLPWWETWLRFRYRVLPHWSDFWWFRWGIVAALAAIVVALLVNRAKRSGA